jgi:cysteine sulfinate desulfinase
LRASFAPYNQQQDVDQLVHSTHKALELLMD